MKKQPQYVCEVIAGDTIRLTIKKNGSLYFIPKEIEILYDDNKRHNTENAHGDKKRNEPDKKDK